MCDIVLYEDRYTARDIEKNQFKEDGNGRTDETRTA